MVTMLHVKTLKTPIKMWFASCVIFFQETWEYQNVVSICYGWQQATHLSSRVPTFQTWDVAKVITCTFFSIVKLCVLNQS
jgi:hypothetical protein